MVVNLWGLDKYEINDTGDGKKDEKQEWRYVKEIYNDWNGRML